MLVNPEPLWLTHTVSIEKQLDTNKWGDPVYDTPIQLSNVRFEHDVTLTGSGNSKTETKGGVVFVFPYIQDSVQFDKSWVDARITDSQGDQFIVKSVVTNKQDTTDDVYSWELEVV